MYAFFNELDERLPVGRDYTSQESRHAPSIMWETLKNGSALVERTMEI